MGDYSINEKYAGDTSYYNSLTDVEERIQLDYTLHPCFIFTLFLVANLLIIMGIIIKVWVILAMGVIVMIASILSIIRRDMQMKNMIYEKV